MPKNIKLQTPAYPIEDGIKKAVYTLERAGVETYESCQGGEGHAFPEPTVRFHGDQGEGLRALNVALQAGLKVSELRRVWTVIDGEAVEPSWEMTFVSAPHMANVCEYFDPVCAVRAMELSIAD
jgi:hypothetical protein